MKKIFYYFLIVIFNITLLIGVEFILREFFPIKMHSITSKDYIASEDPDLLYEPKPLANDNNSQGIRGPEHSLNKSDDTYRIVVIGDSVAFGFNVGYSDCYAARLQKLLNTNLKGKFEVINLGVPGYRITQCLERLKKKGLSYHPDLVIYGYWHDDISNSMGHREEIFYPKDFFDKNASSVPSFRYEKYHFLLKYQLFRRLILLWRMYRPSPKPFKLKPQEYILSPKIAEYYKHFLYTIKKNDLNDEYHQYFLKKDEFYRWNSAWGEFVRLSQKYHYDFFVLFTPVMYGPKSHYYWKPMQRFEHKILDYYSIPYLDLTSVIYSMRPKSVYQEFDAEHPNENGHKVISEELFKYIKKQVLKLQ